MLGTPPAFVLSQDQTLHCCFFTLLSYNKGSLLTFVPHIPVVKEHFHNRVVDASNFRGIDKYINTLIFSQALFIYIYALYDNISEMRRYKVSKSRS